MADKTPVWFITAASSGFGAYMALEALSRGHKVIASGRNPAKLDNLKEKGADILALDVTWTLDQLEKVAQEANSKYGYITHLVNAAGYILIGAVEETSPKEDYDIFNTNVFGMLNVIKAFLPYLRASPGHRTISNFGSLASWTGRAGCVLYYGTKWACSGLSEALRDELAPFGISVTAIEPGYFRTGFLNSSTSIHSEKKMDEYENTKAGEVRRMLESRAGKQIGDVQKGSKVIVDILTKSGAAEGKEVPIRIALGSDLVPAIRDKLQATENLLKEWEAVTTATDHVD